jgi:hypothetical protein
MPKSLTHNTLRLEIARQDELCDLIEMDTASPMPWNEADFMREIKGERVLWLTVRLEGHPLSFIVVEFMAHRIHVFKIGYCNELAADIMIEELKRKLSPKRRSITITVHEREVAKQIFLRRHKFKYVQSLPLDDEKTYLFKFEGF